MRAWLDVAVLVKTKNTKGKFAAQPTAGFPFLLQEGDEVALVPPQIDAPRNVVVRSVELIGETAAEVTFEGVESYDVAQSLVGMHCLIRRELVDDEVFMGAPAVWSGFAVVDEKLGEIGSVAGLVDNPAQSLLEVARPDGSCALVPLVDEIVRAVDVEEGVISVSLPSGLLDL